MSLTFQARNRQKAHARAFVSVCILRSRITSYRGPDCADAILKLEAVTNSCSSMLECKLSRLLAQNKKANRWTRILFCKLVGPNFSRQVFWFCNQAFLSQRHGCNSLTKISLALSLLAITSPLGRISPIMCAGLHRLSSKHVQGIVCFGALFFIGRDCGLHRFLEALRFARVIQYACA